MSHTRRPHLQAAAALALFVAVLYGALLFTNRVLASGDILLYFYPYRDYASKALLSGRIPFWNPYIFMGAPFLANPQAAVFYPLHLPLIWLPATMQIYWSAAIHTWLLGFGGYLLVRRLGNGWLAGIVAGLTLAGSGFYGGMIGHLNQMNAAAWLPWLLMAVTLTSGAVRERKGVLHSAAGCAVVVALLLLAGHTQTAYINLFGVGTWTLALAGRSLWLRRRQPTLVQEAWYVPLAIYVIGVVVGTMLAAPQLIPTLELSGLGIRSGGLSFLEATSFSLKPLSLLWTLLPTYGLVGYETIFETAAWSEFIAWIGVLALLLALLGAVKGKGLARWMGIGFVVMGLFLALGRWNPVYWLLHQVVPGFDLFRTPARWMMLYTVGVAVLAGLGAQALPEVVRQRQADRGSARHWLPNAVAWGVPLLLVVELLLAARALPLADPTAPEAVYGLRTAPAHLKTDPGRLLAEMQEMDPAMGGRFLGMSTITYDPGDMADSRRIYRDPDSPQLTESAFNDLIIAQKVQELLVPNLSLFWRIPAVDGYDGGTLPLQRYNDLVALLAPGSVLAPDGRLREQIAEVPPTALLDALHVQYIITDKVRDLWFENVYYDRQIGLTLSPEEPVATIGVHLPFEATHLDLIGAVEGSPEALADLSGKALEILSLQVETADGANAYIVTAGGAKGADFADGMLGSEMAARSGATIAYRDVEGGKQEYRVRIPLEGAATPTRIGASLLETAQIVGLSLRLQAVTIYDERTGTFSALLPSDRGGFALSHSGDVKVYENLGNAPRAWLAYNTLPAESEREASVLLGELVAAGDARSTVVVEAGGPSLGLDAANIPEGDAVEILSYQPEQVILKTSSAVETLLVLADANYPGWRATVDGVPAPIYTTNVLFRGVPLEAGAHTVEFTFVPTGWRTGLWIGVGGMLLLALLWLGARWRSDVTGNPR